MKKLLILLLIVGCEEEVILSQNISGCLDVEACNFNNNALEDDGSCIYAEEPYDCNGDCIEGYVDIWNRCYNIDNTTILNKSNYGLTGYIPIEISYLKNLKNLDLSNNQLTGSILEEFGNLTSLTQLNLHNNQLIGKLPSEIGNLANLTSLYLSYNNFEGDIPASFKNLFNLTTISLGGITYNDVYSLKGKNFVSNICNLVNVKNLWLWGLNLNDEDIPDCIQNFSQLNSLSLGANNLTKVPNWIYKLESLEFLGLFDNNILDTLSSEIGNLILLSELSLWGNKFEGVIPKAIGNLIDLRKLYLNYNLFSGNIPNEILNLNNLEILHLNDNNLSNIPDSFCQLGLDWDDYTFTNTLNPYLEELPNFTIYNNQICPPYLDCLENHIGNQFHTASCD